ncbi:MAG: hypothetical protein ACRDHG_02045, partial [Anaerolineales bacterium]
MFAIFVVARLVLFQLDGDRVMTDTYGYLRAAEGGIHKPTFWLGERPFTVPLVYSALGLTSEVKLDADHVRRVTAFQLGLSILGWSVLAVSIGWVVDANWDRVLVMFVVLAFATSLDIA